MTTVPMLRYYGSKWNLAEWIISHMPNHTSYVEPFAGSCAVYLQKQPSGTEVLNDLSEEIVNFYRVMRTNADDLIKAIELTPFSRTEYEASYQPSGDPIESARRLYVKCWQSFNASPVRKTGWRFRRDRGRMLSLADDWARNEGLVWAAMALKHAIIECRPATEVIARYDSPSTLFYVDPPYLHHTRVDPRGYFHEMNDADHTELYHVLQNIKGMAIISGYPSDLYNYLYSGWQCISIDTKTTGSNATECIWLHPNNGRGQRTLFNLP